MNSVLSQKSNENHRAEVSFLPISILLNWGENTRKAEPLPSAYSPIRLISVEALMIYYKCDQQANCLSCAKNSSSTNCNYSNRKPPVLTLFYSSQPFWIRIIAIQTKNGCDE